MIDQSFQIGIVPFFEQEIQGLSKDTFLILQELHSVQKRALSLCLDLVLPQHEQIYPEGISVFELFSLELYLDYRVSIEIQGLSSSTHCNFQGLSRP